MGMLPVKEVDGCPQLPRPLALRLIEELEEVKKGMKFKEVEDFEKEVDWMRRFTPCPVDFAPRDPGEVGRDPWFVVVIASQQEEEKSYAARWVHLSLVCGRGVRVHPGKSLEAKWRWREGDA